MITTDSRLAEYCQWLSDAAEIAFDTEFVSEGSYRPELCLIQVAAAVRARPDELHLTVIDPLRIRDVRPFWEIVCSGEHETIVHAGREEVIFCWHATGRSPARLFDVQLAAGMVGGEYPAGYGNLAARLLGEYPSKGETRTDWRRRPLSDHQVEYAVNDVRYLKPLRDKLRQRLRRLKREDWFLEEMQNWLADVQATIGRNQWRRLAGSASLSSRELAILRELWQWREEEAQRLNKPIRRVLRDDLIVELAKRRTADEKRILALRDFQRRDFRVLAPDLSKCIQRALDLPAEECPLVQRRDATNTRSVLGQFLASALGSICREAQVAPGLVGGPNDVRELVAYRLGELPPDHPIPSLAEGWRAAVIGRQLDDLLHGRAAIRIHDPCSEQPLTFERLESRHQAVENSDQPADDERHA